MAAMASLPQRHLTEQGRERKQQILDAAEALFAARGYGQTRIIDICDAAGVAKGLLYWYFDTKESLFAELVRSTRQQLRRAQATAMDPDADALTRLRQGTEASVRYMADHRAFFALLEVEGTDAALAEVLDESSALYLSDAKKVIAEAIAEGLIPPDDIDLLALGVLGSVSHYTHFHRAGRIDLPVEQVAQFVGQWVVRGLGGC